MRQRSAGNPQSQDKPVRWGPEVPKTEIDAYIAVASTALASAGVPPGLVLGGVDGSTMRESYREFYLTGLQGLASIVEAELSRKLGDVQFVFDRLSAADIQARARSYKTFVESGMSPEAALTMVGMERPA